MNLATGLFLKSGVDAVQGGAKGLVGSNLLTKSDDKKKAADAGDGGDDKGDEKTALLRRQNRAKQMLSRREPTGVLFTDYIQPTAVEFFGAVLFVYVGVVSEQSPSAIVRGAAHGLTLAVLILSFQDISVGYFNPALTIAILITGYGGRGGAGDDYRLLHWRLALCLIGAQMLAGLIGAAFARGTLSYYPSDNNFTTNVTEFERARGGVPCLSPGVGGFQGFFCETLLTCLLAITLLMTSVDVVPFPQQPVSAIAVGMAATAATSATANITGGVLNPARSLGPALVGSDLPTTKLSDQLIYLSAPFFGAGIAAALYRVLFASTEKRLFFTGEGKHKKKEPTSATANSVSKASEMDDERP